MPLVTNLPVRQNIYEPTKGCLRTPCAAYFNCTELLYETFTRHHWKDTALVAAELVQTVVLVVYAIMVCMQNKTSTGISLYKAGNQIL